MTERVQIGDAVLYCGDNMDVLQELSGIHACVTDPPYGLSFMGKKWDYGVPSAELWSLVKQAMLPGAHLLSFAGTRTQHRMAVRIEDAGFDIRDMVAWVYGSGFPKSLDVGKAVDKIDAVDRRMERRYRFTEWMVSACDLTPRQMDAVCNTNTMGRHWTDVPPNGKQPDVPTREYFEMLRPHFGCEIPEWVEQMVDERTVESENFKRRELVEERTMTQGGGNALQMRVGELREVQANITAPATDAARQWQGWGTALKPAMEMITMARKPLIGTVAENVLRHGVGGLNVDGCRVGGFVNTTPSGVDRRNAALAKAGYRPSAYQMGETTPNGAVGRWPANLILDGSEEVLAGFPEANSARASGNPNNPKRGSNHTATSYGQGDDTVTHDYRDTGSAARFFYCAKTSKKDRDEGNKHPTVKPTDLMRYLCRLVTPPGGIVLDPFMGSGSTGKAAMLEGFRFIGIERDREYFDIACRRIEAAWEQSQQEPEARQGVLL